MFSAQANARGDYFPIWGTCLGFELLATVTAGSHILTNCSSSNDLLPLNLTKGKIVSINCMHCDTVGAPRFGGPRALGGPMLWGPRALGGPVLWGGPALWGAPCFGGALRFGGPRALGDPALWGAPSSGLTWRVYAGHRSMGSI